MTAKPKAASKEPEAKPETPPAPEKASPKSSAVGGLAELQAKADADTARGYTGPEKESA